MPEQEVRFAVVLYGGVSLAIYINGVVQELLRMVRATSGLPPRNPDTSEGVYRNATSGLPPRNPDTSEGVYRKLSCLLERGVLPPNDADPGPTDPIKTRFRI